MSWSAEALRNRAAAQRRIRRVCTCGRTFTGNAAWASHQRAHSYTARVIDPGGAVHMPGDWIPGHGYEGRA